MTGARPEEVKVARDPFTRSDPVSQQKLVGHEDPGKTTAIAFRVKQVA